MKLTRKTAAALIAAIAAATITVGTEYAIASQANAAPSTSSFQQEACVTFGHPGSAAGNVMLYDWNDSACPPGTYLVHLAPVPGPTVTVTATPSTSASPTSSATTPAG